MKKKCSLFAILFLSTLLFTTSCNNIFESSTDDYEYDEKKAEKVQAEKAKKAAEAKQEPQAPKIRYASISGELALEGAYPHSIKQKIEDIGLTKSENVASESSDPSRSALPSIPGGSKYYVIASADGKTSVKGQVDQDAGTFKIEKLEIGNFTWTIEAGIRESEAEDSPVLLMDTWPLTLTETNFTDPSVNTHTFTLKPLADDGSGTSTGIVHLEMSLPDVAVDSVDKISLVKTKCISDNAALKTQWGNPSVTITGNTAKLDIDSIKIGSYEVVFSFYNDVTDSFPSFTTTQIINVFKNLTTNTWANGAGTTNNSSGVISGNTFSLTSTILQNYSATQLYVGNPGTYGEGKTGKAPDNENDGSPFAPLATIDKALEIIGKQKRANNYTIHVSEKQTGHFAIQSSITTANAASITIEGVTGYSPELNGGNNGTVLSVNSGVPVILKNITISGGNGDNGGGLYLSDAANVTLDNGTVITGNTAANGGAVYVSPAATFNIKGSARIPYGAGGNEHNEVYLAKNASDEYANITVTGSLTSSSSKVASITAEGWIRNKVLLQAGGSVSDINNYRDRFGFTVSGFNWKYNASTPQSCKLGAPYYISPTGEDDDSRTGTEAEPYRRISFAVGKINDGEEWSIVIDGELGDNQEITGINTTQCSKLIIQGKRAPDSNGNPQDAINADTFYPSLKILTAVPVEIKNLKISGSQSCGLYLDDANVTLSDGTLITGNGQDSTYAGGVFVGATLNTSTLDIEGTAKIKGNTHPGVYCETGAIVNMTGGEISSNSISGVYMNGGTFNLSDGVIKNNTANSGKGVYVNNGQFNVSGKAKVDSSNVVYLAAEKTISVTDTLDESEVATITPENFKRGTKILSASSTIDDLTKAKFKLSSDDSDWERQNKAEGGVQYVCINSPIYVAPASGTVPTGFGNGKTSDATGTKSSPYASIAAALGASDLDKATEPNKITVAGTLTGAQTISGTVPSSLVISGYKASGDTSSSAKIDAGGASGAGSALSVDASGKTVTIQDLTITGGNASGSGDAANGGGIRIAGGSTVRLADGALVTGNKATNGGGVYVDSTAKLLMYGTAWIGDSSGNQATSDTLTSSGSDTGCANTANQGGGIYNDGGIVALGYDAYMDAESNSPKDFTGGVGRNYAGLLGGGIYGKFTISGGSVSCNKSYLQGGGLYIPRDVTDAKITGGSITNNSAQSDGGAAYIYTNAKLSMSGNAEISNNSADRGGGIFTSTGTFEMSGGSFASNTATGAGGAIYQDGEFIMSGSALITPGSEKSNDVYLPSNNGFTVASTTLNGGTTVAAITPDSFRRGRPILYVSSSITLTEDELNTIKGKIALTEDGWNKENIIISSVYAGVEINSPIYVASTAASDSTRKVCSPGVTSGAKGTSAKPYATIAAALGASDLAVAGNKITIDGTIGKQEIAPSASLSAVTIAGYKAASDTTSSAKIDAGGTTGAGSALTVNKSGLTVTITDLTITGGTGTEVSSTLYGGGIYINAGNVQLTNGAVVNGNSAAIGGGVYLNAGNLYINGSAVVGKPGVNECAQNVSGKYGNMATLSGGGIGVQNGTLWLGYTPPAGSSTTPAAATTSGGVLYNLVCSGGERHGGGIDNNSGTLNIAHGYVSYNYACSTGTGDNDIGCGGGISTAYVMKLSGDAEISHNKSANGGGVYITRDSTNGSFTMEGGKVTLNESEAQHGQYGYGGGVAIGASGSFTLSGGELSSNEAAVNGGAVWHNGAGFEIKGTATKIPAGTNDSNNIAFYNSSKRIKVTGSTSHGNGEIAVTPASWSRGSQIFEDGSTTTYFSKFKLTDPEWSIVAFNDGSKTTGRIDADIYVAPTSSTTTVNSVTYGKGAAATAGGLGTKAKPYSTIADAVAQCWGGPNDTGTGVSRTINIVGTITGAQEITSAVNASGITLKGVNTSATLNGGMSSTSATKKSTLTISTVVPVTIQTLTVKGGYSSDNGGGILVNGVGGASLTLGENAKVSGNTATANGGGIYFKGTNAPGGTGSLIMNSTSAVSGNTATGTSSKGGGIYLQYASLYMSGSALIGDTAGTIAATSADGGHSNMANSGGGVYCDTSANIKLGYASASDASGTDLSETYGIRHNYATRFGGGVYMAAGSLTLKTGKIFANGTSATSGNNGGGVYVSNVASFTMYGGTVAKNKAYNGGGVCIDGNSSAGGTFTMSGGTIGDSSSGVTSAATTTGNAYSNYAANLGGGLYAGTKTSVTLNGGYISYNYSVENGGGIYTNSDTTFKANAKYNTSAASGGGIYSYGSSNTLTMSGGTIYGNKATGTSTDTDNQKFLGGGGVWFDGTFKMSGGTIQGNSANWYGGGVATYEGYFYMSGSAVIGDKSKESLPVESATTSPTANRAKYGGGFAATNDADVYLGYSGKTGTTLNASSLADGGIYYNYASEHGGGYYQIGGRKLIMSTGNISYNKAAASASKGGGIYIDSGLQMSGGTITGNYAENGGAVYLNNCVYEASGSIYIPYSSASGSVNKENVVAMNGTSSKITVTDSLTNTNSKVMTVEPRAWAIGTLVADKNTSISLDNFKTSVGKIGIVKNGLYSKVELSTSQGSTTGVVGVDMNNITETDVKNYISGKNLSAESTGKWAKEGLSYFVVQYVGSGAKNGKVGIVRVHDNRDSTSPATKGKVLANGIGFLSSPNAVSTTEKTYNTSTPTWFNEGLDIFNTGSSSWWDGDQVGVAHSTTSGELLVYYWEKVKGIRMD